MRRLVRDCKGRAVRHRARGGECAKERERGINLDEWGLLSVRVRGLPHHPPAPAPTATITPTPTSSSPTASSVPTPSRVSPSAVPPAVSPAVPATVPAIRA